MVVRFFLEPKSFKIPPTKCQWGPIGHLYDLGWSMGSAWWPYGGRLSDPFFDFLPPTSKMKKIENILGRWVIGPLIGRSSPTALRSWSQVIHSERTGPAKLVIISAKTSPSREARGWVMGEAVLDPNSPLHSPPRTKDGPGPRGQTISPGRKQIEQRIESNLP